jgi:hypothetical protein
MSRPLLAAALAFLALLAGGCGVSPDDEPRALDPATAPFNAFESPRAEEPQGPGRVALYFVRNDRVVFTSRAVERSTSIEELLDLLLDGPTPEQVDRGTDTRLPAGLTVEDVEVVNGVAVVTLGNVGTQATQPLGYAQIVATLTAPGRAQAVRFRADGVDLQVPRGDGQLSFGPFTRQDYAELLALPSPAPSAPAAPAPAGASPSPG